MRAPWLAYVLGAVVASAVEFAIPGGLLRDSLFCLIGASAVVAMLVGVRRHRPFRRLPWHLLAAGVAFWVVGDALWTWFDHVAHVAPFPSVADVAYLLAYPLLAAGLFELGTARRGPSRARRSRATLIDALIAAVAVGLVLWVAFIEPTWTDPAGTLLERVVGVAYPMGDMVLITMLVHFGTGPVIRTPALRLLAGAFVVILAADLVFQAAAYFAVLDDNILLLDPLWLLAYVLWGAAALHPTMRDATEPRPPDAGQLTLGRVTFLGIAVLLLPSTILVEMALGVPVHTAAVSIAGILLIVLTITRVAGMVLGMREQAARLEHLAETDFLTGLDNRRRFTEKLGAALVAPRQDDAAQVAVLLVALERFAEINDTLGHRTGDALLRGVAGRLRTVTGPSVAVARMGGDAFGVLIVSDDDGEELLEHCHLVRGLLSEPITLSDLTVTADVAVGLVVSGPNESDADAVLHQADVALSVARERTGRVARYAPEMESGGALVPVLMAEMRSALAAGQLVMHYQPQVEAATGRVFGVEALVRWEHPQHGLLGPMSFVPGAERTGLIRPLTLYVLDQSLAQCAAWRREGRALTVAVNLSVRNLLDPGLVDDVRAALARHGLDAAHLELEITETMAMVDPVRSLEVLGALNDLGVTLSVDDYGTGYGSLAYLQRLPVRRLKVDRSFVAEILQDPASAAIVRSTIELARHLGLSVVAEGVEDDETLLSLLRMGCFGAQGFGLGRPVAAEAVPALIRAIEDRVPTLVGHTPARVPRPRAAKDGQPATARSKPVS